MKKREVLSALDDITEMTDHEIQINSEFIRKTALAAYSVLKCTPVKKEADHAK